MCGHIKEDTTLQTPLALNHAALWGVGVGARYLRVALGGAVRAANGVADRSWDAEGRRSTTHGAYGGGARSFEHGLLQYRGIQTSLQTSRSKQKEGTHLQSLQFYSLILFIHMTAVQMTPTQLEALFSYTVMKLNGMKWKYNSVKMTYFGTSCDGAPFASSGSNADWELPLLSCRLKGKQRPQTLFMSICFASK